MYSNIYLATDVFVPNLYVSLHSNTDDTVVQSSVMRHTLTVMKDVIGEDAKWDFTLIT